MMNYTDILATSNDYKFIMDNIEMFTRTQLGEVEALQSVLTPASLCGRL